MCTPVLEEIRQAHPELHELLDKINDCSERKLYHQLTETIINVLTQPCFHYAKPNAASELEKLFTQFLRSYENKFDMLMWAHILQIVCKPQVPSKALELLAPQEEMLAKHPPAYLLWKLLKCEKMIKAGQLDEAKDTLDVVGKKIDDLYEVDAMIYSSFHQISALLWKTLERWQEYYTSSIQYLAYTPLIDIPEDERAELAFDIGKAAVISEEEYEFGELLQQEILASLKGSPYHWLQDLLSAFGEGSFEHLEEALSKHASKIKSCQELQGIIEITMRPKMCALALMELVFRKPKKQRVISFEEVSLHCRVDMNLVEGLLMKAMCAGLIRGQINEVSQHCSISWVKPRILDLGRVEMMREKIDAWSAQTELLLTTLEEMTPELLVS